MSSFRLARLMTSAIFTTLIAMASTLAYAQGGGATSSLSGVVVDTSGAVIPGADIKVVNDATKAEFTAVSAAQGNFTIPSIDAGTYTVTITLMGFKTAVLKEVRINAAVPASVRPVLEVGGLDETVVVRGGSEIIQTQTASVATTLDVNQISNLPLTSRSVLDFVTSLPGVNTPGGSRDSTVNGLPQSTINITIDGMSAQDNHLKTGDGFFARVSPRLDAIEEVTVTTAAQGAESTGQGAVQIRFVTRAGTNTFTGSSYYYLRHHALNANTWFNNRDLAPDPKTGKAPKAENILHQPGTRVGGPIVIPGLWDGRNKAFFFVNYEESRAPGQLTRNRNILHPRGEQGFFRYDVGGQVREVNVLALAAASGHVSSQDPTVARLIADIRGTTGAGSLQDLTNPALQQFTWQVKTQGLTRYPTVRIDYNLTDKHRLSGSTNITRLNSTPDTLNNRDPVYPGFPGTGSQISDRYTAQGTLRSALTTNLVNEVRIGRTGGATLFSPEISAAQYGGTSIANQDGFLLGINAAGVANAAGGPNFQGREAGTKLVENTLSWIRGSHSLSMGGSFTQVDLWRENQTFVPTVNFGIVSGDPADAMFTTANFPGASTPNLTAARNLYAVLTGRVSSVTANVRLNASTDEYVYLGKARELARQREVGLFVSDTWRWKPNFTVNMGLRYELQLPFYSNNNSYSTATMADVCGVSGVKDGGCNLFQPGVMPGLRPTFQLLQKGQYAYNRDLNNFGPNLGFNWVPNFQSGIVRSILGAEGDSSFRAGYSLAYSRPGTNEFASNMAANPGILQTANRELGLGNLGPLPLLFSDRSRLAQPAFPLTRQYPLTEVATGDVQIFAEKLQVPYAQSWTAGWQRKITRDIVGEIRYVGTRHLQGWTDYDYNELNIVENGFLNEFRRAQANLAANIAAGRSADGFKYTGIAGTSPLPIFLAYFTGQPASASGATASYTGTLWANSTFVNPLARFNPQPFTAADALDADAARRQNALTAGLPANFLVVNPNLLGGAIVTSNGGYTKFNGMQMELRKRLSHGLQFQASYSFGRGYESQRFSFRVPRQTRIDSGAEGSVTHAFKANWVYELPFGQGRRFGGNAGGFLDRIIGGWAFDGVARIQSGRLVDLGNVRLVGMSAKDVEKMFKLRFDDANRVVYMLPQDVIDQTVRAFSVSATDPSGYGALGAPSGRYFAPANGPDCIEINGGAAGDCGVGDLVVTGPRQVRFDLSAVKRVKVVGRVVAEFRGEFLNAFNHPWFTPAGGVGSTNSDGYRVTGVGENSSRIIQLVSRISW